MVSSSSFPRLFTVNEANALLPSVRPLIDKILENIRRLKSKSETVIRNERLDPEAPNPSVETLLHAFDEMVLARERESKKRSHS